ncbi:MAG: bacteriohemerythrin [Gammaproteobacteria bacterium]|nr:bacteriohemerythrin [Gammaproteobacteria bacterium]MDH5802264.1 bacteriohemerythrin [Gammaproteobacteria bacterium]
MSMLEWDDSYSVKVEMLDEHHKTLFKIVNRFYETAKNNSDIATLTEIFKKVLDYTQMHFKIEEYYMKKHEYPTYDKHKQIHEDLVQRASSLHDDIQSGKVGAVDNACTFLKDWLEKHIKGVDTQYGPHLNRAGMH